MTAYVGAAHFSGLSKLQGPHSDHLAALIRGLAQQYASDAVQTVADLTDNSGGTDGEGTVAALGLFAPYTTAGTDLASKTAVDDFLNDLQDGLTELVAKLEAARARVPWTTALTNSVGGATADGTIAAITVSGWTAVATGGSPAAVAAANTALSGARDRIAQIIAHTNRLCTAVGVAPIVDNSGGEVAYSNTFAAVVDTTGTAGDGTALTGIANTPGMAVAVPYANAVKTIATKLNAILGTTTLPVAKVVAV